MSDIKNIKVVYWGTFLLALVVLLFVSTVDFFFEINKYWTLMTYSLVASIALHVIFAFGYVTNGILRKNIAVASFFTLLLYYILLFLLYVFTYYCCFFIAAVVAAPAGEYASKYIYLPPAIISALVPALIWFYIVRRPIYRIILQAYGK